MIEIVRASKSIDFYQGEQVELVCSTPESKPAAQLDWLVDQLNLSSIGERHSKLASKFTVSSRRFVRLPQGSVRQNPNLSLKSPNGELQYEVINGTQLASDSKAPTILVGRSFDQLGEVVSSRLSFILDSNLFKEIEAHRSSKSTRSTLSEVSGDEPANQLATTEPRSPNQKQTSLTRKRRTLKASRQNSQSLSKSNGWLRTSADKSKLTLQISCVSRVLHLNMTNNIKIRLNNRARNSEPKPTTDRRLGGNLSNSGEEIRPIGLPSN